MFDEKQCRVVFEEHIKVSRARIGEVPDLSRNEADLHYLDPEVFNAYAWWKSAWKYLMDDGSRTFCAGRDEDMGIKYQEPKPLQWGDDEHSRYVAWVNSFAPEARSHLTAWLGWEARAAIKDLPTMIKKDIR